MTDTLEQMLATAVAAHQRGELPEAVRGYRQVLEARPQHDRTLYLLGTALLQSGQFTDAAETLRQAAGLRGDLSDVHNNLGIALQALGQRDEARQSFRDALDREPDSPDALFNLGRLLWADGQDAEAEPLLRRAVERQPNDRPARVTLADVLCRMEQWDAAVLHLRAARDLPDPAATAEEDPGARLGSVLARLEQYEEAAEILREAVSRFPAQYQLLSNLSFVAEKLGRYEEAEQAAGLAVESKSDLPEAWNHLGLALRGQGRVPEAIDAFQRAVALRPEFPLAEFNLAVTRMLAGDLAGGSAGYERRFDLGEAEVARFGEPRWDGSPLAGKTLLVVAEQGLGDTIQFSRFLCGLAAGGARVLFRCAERLHPLLSTLEPAGQRIELFAPGQPLPPVDCWVPLLSIPGLLGISLSTLPQRPHWLTADPALKEHWAAWLAEHSKESRCRIGIAWQGAPGYRRDRERSIPLAAFAPLADVPGVQLISLQLGPGTEQIPAAAGTVDVVTPPESFDQESGAFQDTAALMQSLDLVICSDSSVAHLAGALGVPVWVALSRVPEWRWQLERTDSPWYPSMRLFRQMKRDDWNSVFQQMAAELKQRNNGE